MGWIAAGTVSVYFTGFIVWIASSVHGPPGHETVASLPLILFFALAPFLGAFLSWLINQ